MPFKCLFANRTKSNIDEAVVAKAKTIGIENSVEEYKK